MSQTSTQQVYRIEDERQIELLASPLRQDILDSLSALGPSTVAELATSLGVPADALYYHMRKLERAGLVLVEEGAAPSGREAAVYSLPAPSLQLDYDVGPEARAAIGRAIAAALRSATRDFTAGLESEDAVVEGSARNIWGARARGWLSPEELAELNDLLHRAWELFRASRPGAGRQLCSFTWALSPIEARPPRREVS